MATKTINIAGIAFDVEQPYVEGSVLNANEASVLNQTRLENVRNNVAGKLKAAQAAAEKANPGQPYAASQETIDAAKAYAASYVFGAISARKSEPVDPIEREAHRLADAAIRQALRDNKNADGTAAPIKVKDLPEGKFDELVAALAKSDAGIQKEAKRRVDAAGSIGQSVLAGLGDLTAATSTAASA